MKFKYWAFIALGTSLVPYVVVLIAVIITDPWMSLYWGLAYMLTLGFPVMIVSIASALIGLKSKDEMYAIAALVLSVIPGVFFIGHFLNTLGLFN